MYLPPTSVRADLTSPPCAAPVIARQRLTKPSAEVDAGGRPTAVARYSFHSLQHAAANLFIAHPGWTPKRVQIVLGHASIQMTFDRYGYPFEDRDNGREAMKKLEAAVLAA